MIGHARTRKADPTIAAARHLDDTTGLARGKRITQQVSDLSPLSIVGEGSVQLHRALVDRHPMAAGDHADD